MKLNVALRLLAALLLPAVAAAGQMPQLVERDGRHALLVDGRPYLVLGMQMHNSSAWPQALPNVWQAAEYLHVNTVEAPVYWEQMERERGHFDFSNVDQVVLEARQHRLHVVLLWFGTWKNARNHYTPEWIKTDTKLYPRLMDANGRLTDSMSPFGEETLKADSAAFAALMRHVKKIDGEQHTVILVQVENESGSLDSVRDFSPEAQQRYGAAVPQQLTRALHVSHGTWEQVFGNGAAERFQAWAVASYIDRVAAAGKAEYPLPLYLNAWVRTPDDLEGEGPRSYPSGGAVDRMLDVWKATAHSIDMISPDIYLSGDATYQRVVDAYTRPDNALFVPENSHEPQFARYIFRAFGNGGVGFSVWGADKTNVNPVIDPLQNPSFAELADFRRSFILLGSMQRELAAWNFAGKVKSVLEDEPSAGRRMNFGRWEAVASFGYRDEGEPKGTGPQGVLLVAQVGENEFVVSGYDAHVDFHLAAPGPRDRWQILRAEEGSYEGGTWKPRRWLNGDECDFGVNFGSTSQIVRFRLGTY